jgi:hypothetical protein
MERECYGIVDSHRKNGGPSIREHGHAGGMRPVRRATRRTPVREGAPFDDTSGNVGLFVRSIREDSPSTRRLDANWY